jgi:hypothetical protein
MLKIQPVSLSIFEVDFLQCAPPLTRRLAAVNYLVASVLPLNANPTIRITSSPTPVLVAAPISLSTNKAAPMIGESPTRPCILYAMPLVVHAPDKFCFVSNATIPMVSWFSILATGLYLAVFNHSFHAFSDSLVSRFFFFKSLVQRKLQCAIANQKYMWCFFHHFFVLPKPDVQYVPGKLLLRSWQNSSIMHESNVTLPSRSGKPPNPTELSFGSPSGTRAPASTASNARPSVERIFHASTFAPTPKFQVEITTGLETLAAGFTPCFGE